MVSKAWEELNKLLEKGIFKVGHKIWQVYSISEEEVALVGAGFEDNGIAWKVIKVAYSVKEKKYYDVDLATGLI